MPALSRDDCPPYITRDTSEIRELLNPRITPGCHNLSLAEATLYPGCSTLPHRHPRSEEVYSFLSGTGEMRLGEETFAVTAGQTVFIPSAMVHECSNTGDAPLVFLCHCAPAYSHEDTELVTLPQQ